MSTALRRTTIGLTAVTLLAGAGTALANAPANVPAAPEASIPFANLRGTIRDWQADGDRGMWIQDAHRRWYYARFMAPCISLPFKLGVHFKTNPSGELDRFSSIRSRDTGDCQFTSFVRSDGPPRKAKKADAAAAHAAAASAPAHTADTAARTD
ncbi:MAG: hypothetical protein IT480_18050 [Gammaproteobacteria bacterium]|nr:hypothetical protein [Gammaproteobacteria bacterium]